ncbi:MAG TPA: O-antigen ligase family protein [Solirubrobacterales bacterium]|nr:O-antigen ligase family protein [Solirubrobacterales bacterium]
MGALETPERKGRAAAPAPGRPAGARFDWGGAATWLLAAFLVVYLALENGGYDPIPRDQVGVAVWWLVLLGVAVEALPVPGRTRAGLAVLGLLAGFGAWTAISLGWTQSAERTADELARVATYLGVLVLGICLATRRRPGARQVLHGVTFGLGLIAALGVLSRLQMAWFPVNELGKVLPGIEIERRLSYPLGYSSAIGALAGMTLPLLLAATASARTIAAQALAAAAIPLAGLALYLATSGTGAIVAVAAMLAFLALAPDRVPKLLTLAAGAGGAALLALAVDSRDALARGLPTPAAEAQGDEVMWIALGICAAVAVAQVGIGLAARNLRRPRWLRPSRGEALIATAAVVLVAIPVGFAAGLPGEASDRWEVFKSHGEGARVAPSSPASILDSTSSGRYQFWQSAVEAGEAGPWHGAGAGAFETYWAQRGSYKGFVRSAHSLYLEAFVELGIVGLVLIGGFVLVVLGTGAVRSLRAPPEQRLLLAAATAGATGFAMAAALDWVWQLAALAVAFMLLAAVAVSGYSLPEPTRRRRRSKRQNRHRLQRAAVAAVAVAALIAIWFPLRGATHLRQSQIDAAHGELAAALQQARDAADAQPYAAAPLLQEALVLEQQGRLGPAAAAAAEATRKEEANWRTWTILARIEAERGRVERSLHAYGRAKALNPNFILFRTD